MQQLASVPRRRLALLIGLVILLLVGVLLRPVSTAGLIAQLRPAASYAEALRRVQLLQAHDTAEVNPVCHTQLLSHGQRTAQTIVFFHGFTNCPRQFAQLGQIFYDKGYNVLIPRVPHHGLRDTLTDDLANLTAEEMVTTTDEAIGIAQGLGERVTVVGLSGGGVMAAWAAQFHPEVVRTVSIAPVYGKPGLPAFLVPSVTNAVLMLPNQFLWWDTELKERRLAPLQAYPRFPTHALGEMLRLGLAVQRAAAERGPKVPLIVVVTNAADHSVDNAITDSLSEQWQTQGAKLVRYEFPADQDLIHDVIDPAHPRQQVAKTYPRLINLIMGQR